MLTFVQNVLVARRAKFVGMVPTIKTGKRIVKICVKHGMRILFIHGNSQPYPVSEWVNYDVVIYTETITVGVDFDGKHFDCFIGIYHPPMNPELFVQGLLRVRKFSTKNHYLFMKKQTPNHQL